MQKIYCYVDESGQDTKGTLFIVSVLVLTKEKENIISKLEIIENQSKKKNIKWHKAKYSYRKNYIEELIKLKELQNSIFFEIFNNGKNYIEFTSYATAKAILKKSKGKDYKTTIFVDGLKKAEIKKFTKGLRDLRIKIRKIRGVRKEENNIFIRLVDSICGLVRDSKQDNNEWAKNAFTKLKNNNILKEL